MKIALQRILVATDFGDESHVALKYGVALAEAFDASLHVLHVLETIAGAEPLAVDLDARKAVESAIEAAAWDELRGLLTADEQTRLRARLALEWGLPFVEIIGYAKTHQIDLITMGTHGKGKVARVILGSVAEQVMRSAPCPTLTTRHPEREFVR
jgi:nucleotide-binding universal stress UspA family protein